MRDIEMKQDPEEHQRNRSLSQKPYWRSKGIIFFILFILLVGVFVILHNYYDFGIIVPIFLVLLCPIFMYFIMRDKPNDRDDSK